jgi:hypothetical protein
VTSWLLVDSWRLFFAVLVYLAGAIAFVLIADARIQDFYEGAAILATASLACGWLAAWWPAAFLPLVLLPLSQPFGYPESDFAEPGPLWFSAAFVIPPSAVLILVGVGLNRVWSRRRHPHPPAAQR